MQTRRGKGLGTESEEKREPVSDIDTGALDSLKVLDPDGRSGAAQGIAFRNSGQGLRATGGDRPGSGRRLVHSRRPRSSARIVCRHEHASYRRAGSILSFAAHVAHAIDNRAFECASRSD